MAQASDGYFTRWQAATTPKPATITAPKNSTTAFRQADQAASAPKPVQQPAPVYRPPAAVPVYNPPQYGTPAPVKPPANSTTAFRQADQQASQASPANNPLSGAKASATATPGNPNLPAWMNNVTAAYQQFNTQTVPNALNNVAHGFNTFFGQTVPGLVGSIPGAVNSATAATSKAFTPSNLANTANWLINDTRNFVTNPRNYIEQMQLEQQRRASGQVFGVDYGPNWTRSDYNPANDPNLIGSDGKPMGQTWRQQLGGQGILMTPQEYLQRRDAWDQQYTPGLQDWQNKAFAAAGSMSPDEFNKWLANNPRPTGFLQTQQEWINRNNAAPTGYTYVPFGSGYIRNATLPDLPQQPTQPTTGGGSSYGGYSGGSRGGGGYGGGGGGGGYGDSGGGNSGSPASDFYNRLLQWRVLEVQGG